MGEMEVSGGIRKTGYFLGLHLHSEPVLVLTQAGVEARMARPFDCRCRSQLECHTVGFKHLKAGAENCPKRRVA